MDKLNVLILGDGILATEIKKQTNWDNVSRKLGNIDIENVESWNFNQYNVIINCIANTDTYSNDRESHWNVNCKFLNNLIKYCNHNNLKLVHISTEYLYTGSKNFASEMDVPVHCDNWYGYTKLIGDGLVQLLSSNYLICRCMHKEKPFKYDNAWIDQIGNFDYVDVISEKIISLVINNAIGLYNVGTDIKSIYDLAKKTNKIVSPSFSSPEVPKNISMNVAKMDKFLTEHTPFFSIAIPTYEYKGKGVEFLKHSFSIIEKQSFKDFEVVVSDHSLNKDIENLCDEWKSKFRLRYFKNNNGRGIISPNINFAMSKCVGKYIKILFQDDYLYDSESLENQFNFISDNDDVNWFATHFYHSSNGFDIYRPFIPIWNDNIWIGNNTIGCPTVITIKNKNILPFDDNLNWLMDVDFYKKMYDIYGKPLVCNKFTVVNRTWGERLTDTTTQETVLNETRIMISRYS